MQKGFSLIELAISIVVIGLIVAAVSAGGEILKQAQLKQIVLNMNSLASKVISFKKQYGSLPGDMDNAEVFFSNCAETPANCNGDGNRAINHTITTANEVYKALIHLNRAGLIEDDIAEMPDAHVGVMNGIAHGIDDEQSGYFVAGGESASTIAWGMPVPMFQQEVAIYFGGYSTGSLGYVGDGISPKDAYSLDKKIDDGAIVGGNPVGGLTGKFRGESDDVASTCLDSTASYAYRISTTSKACSIGLAVDF